MSQQLDSNNYSVEKILTMVKNDSTVQQSIKEAAEESPEDPWTLIDIQDNLYDALNLELNFDDTDTCGALLTYYNDTQNELAKVA